jgi:cystathionine beta-synthase
VDVFVAGMGTGGTISGTGKFLKEKNPRVRVVGADPEGSILREYFYTKRMVPARTYKVEGIGEDFIPTTTHFEYIDEIEMVNDRESLNLARRIGREEGILVGGSAGTAMVAALRVAARLTKDHIVVVLFPDTGERYLSKVHSDEWMRDNRLLDTRDTVLADVLRGKRGTVPALATVPVETTVREALELIRHHDISQLPVIDGAVTVGTVTEGRLLRAILETPALLDSGITKIMDRPLPVLKAWEKVDVAMKILAGGNSAVLIEDDSRLIGIVTRIDLIEYVSV